MSRIERITITFDVYERDMPSELRAKYRQAAIDAMSKYHEDVKEAIEEFGRDSMDPDIIDNVRFIDKMLEDCNR